jgi:hypothetical protein
VEQWQIDAIQKLLVDTEVKQVERKRFYISSQTYGDSRYHLVDRRHNGVQIEQTTIDEKWGSRVNLQEDEIPAVLKVLLTWYLEDISQSQSNQEDDDLDLEAHPF